MKEAENSYFLVSAGAFQRLGHDLGTKMDAKRWLCSI
ncbi:MAG: hypothetical protein CM1200mP5_6520 [Candidatus Pelagibacterales bacterium]|nr:MAG: hypothetical protein CM1200mP5_6520 [Pelagibacterales bacterium]